VEQETTKVVREMTMPMIESQKQNALHKGTQGSNKDQSGEGEPKERIKEKEEVQLEGSISIQNPVVGKETTLATTVQQI